MAEEQNLIGKEILTYRIESLIGKGGMGSVYLATNKHINQKVAIKVLNVNLAESHIIRQKFVNEAKTLLALDHPNIVHFLNFVENEDGVFLIMEYVDGITLDDFINTKQGLIVETKVYKLFNQILDAFAYAHKRGVVHRDIKPANIILTNDNEGNFVVKVLDFGIARIISESNEEEKGLIIGTPAYMSPEQVRGEDVDERSDIYSLGVLLHQMLTGHAPYDSTTLSETEIQKKVVEDPLPRMKEYYQYVSDRIQKVVDKATAKDPSTRYPNCSAFRKDFLPKPPIPLWQKITAAVIFLLLIGGGYWFWDYNYHVKTYYYKDYVEVWGVPKGIGKADYKHREKTYKFVYQYGKLQHLSLVNSKGNVVEDGESERFDRPINAKFEYQGKDILRVFYKDRNGRVLFKKRYDKQDSRINMFVFEYNDRNNTEKLLPNNLTGYVRLEDDFAERGQISRFALDFDSNGFVTSLHYTNRDGKVVCDKENIYGKRYERDDKGRITKEYYLAQNDSVTSTTWGLGIKEFKYENDNLVEAVYLSPDDSPSYDDSDGVSIYTMEYDNKWGNLTHALHKSSDRKPMITKKQGMAGIEQKFNNEGQVVELYYLGTDGKPMYCISAGSAGVKMEYDENGYTKQSIFIDEIGKPVNNDIIGGTIVKYENDRKGNQLNVQYFDANNEPYETFYGYSKIVAKYDSIGNQTEIFYYNKKDALCAVENMDDIAGVKYEYNDRNKIVKETYYDTSNQPAANNNGVIVTICKYDDSGNFLNSLRYCDADEKTLKLSNEGIAGSKQEYKDGYEVKREFFDEKEKTITSHKLGYAIYSAIYENGKVKEESYFDKDNNPIDVKMPIPLYGFYYKHARVKYEYDSHGNCTEIYPYDKNGRLTEITDMQGRKIRYIEHREYDNYGNMKERTYYDANGNETLCEDRYFKLKSIYNDKHQEIESRAFDTNDNPVNTSLGYATMKAEYDVKKGYVTKYSVFNTSDRLLYYWKPEYNIHGNITKISYYTPDNKLRQDNFAIERNTFNKLGKIVEYAMYNHLDKAANYYDGWHRYTMEYDEQGNPLYQKYYDANNKLLGTKKWNEKTGEWEHIYDWRQYWINSIPNCPFPIDNYGTEVSSISLTGNSCNITIRFTGMSKYSMENSEIEACKDLGKQLAQAEKRNSQMPSSTQLTVIGVDMAKREMFRVTY